MKLSPETTYEPIDVYRGSQKTSPKLSLSDEALKRVEESRKNYEDALDNEQSIYGSTTGFGPLVTEKANDDSKKQADQLINHLGIGTGEYFERSITRCAMILRAITVSQGYSGIQSNTLQDFISLINEGLVPVVPRTGSVGASGDLIPMANVILAFQGNGLFHEVQKGTGTIPAEQYYRSSNTSTLNTSSREALALVNGVPFCTALATYSYVRLSNMVKKTEDLIAWIYASMGCSREALSSTLNEVKGHPEQATTAQSISETIESMNFNHDSDRALQEVYSLRGVPQIVGSVRKILNQSRTTLIEEINGVDDNPVIPFDNTDNEIFHGANFIGQNVAFCSDSLNEGTTQLGNLIESQISVLLSEDQNNGLPKMLTRNPGQNSGLAGLEINSTAIVSEMRNDAQSYGAMSLSTNGRNQDIVPMALEAAKNAYKQTERLSQLVAMLGIAMSQYDWLYKRENNVSLDNKPEWFPDVDPVDPDRPLREDVRRISQRIVNPEVS